MTYPVTTRSELATKHGLAALIRKLLKSGVPAITVEPPAPDVALNATVEGLAALDAPVHAFIGPPIPPADAASATLATAEKARRVAVADALADALPWLAATRCRRLIIPLGPAGLAFEADLLQRPSEPAAERAAATRQAKELSTVQRQLHAEVVCRTLHELAKRLEGVQLLLLPTCEPGCFLDPQSADWILGDLKGVGLALDIGAVFASETQGLDPLSAWIDQAGGSLGFILLADHDGRGDGALLPGAGRLDLSALREVIGRRTPVAVRCDPRASFDDVLASAAETARRLGPVGDLDAW